MELSKLCDNCKSIFEIEDVLLLKDKLKEVCLTDDAEKINMFCDMQGDLSVDLLQKIYQYWCADRENKKQDYTPVSLAKLVSKVADVKNSKVVYDMCAGSGALTIQAWNENKNAIFVCAEIDDNVLPFLMFNLVIRNVNGYILKKDILNDRIFEVYKLSKGKKFSKVKRDDKCKIPTPDVIISNPPFNLKWKPEKGVKEQDRFSKTTFPPESNANYAFILSALDMAEKCVMIFPNGLLSTNNKDEVAIKAYLVENGFVDSVITAPDKMFEATDIPTCVICLNRKNKNKDVGFVRLVEHATVELRKQNGQYGGKSHTKRVYEKKINVLSDEVIEKTIECIFNRKQEECFSVFVPVEEIKKQEYILVPQRYLPFKKDEGNSREYIDIVSDLNHIIEEKNKCKLTINETLAKKIGFDLSLYEEPDVGLNGLNDLIYKITGVKIKKDDYFRTTKNKNEVKFENNSKDDISSVLMMIFSTWKQHVYYLNNEENRLLVELRDKMINDLMSGKIEV